MIVYSRLYSSCAWEPKQIRRLIGDGKLAARTKGTEESTAGDGVSEECPICFLQYTALNQTKCCQAYICTECFLQVRNPKDTTTACPFCNQKLAVQIAALSVETTRQRRTEEQRVIEAQIKAQSSHNDSNSNTKEQAPSSTTTSSSLPPLSAQPRNTEFGASLEQNERIARLRHRSSSGASSSAGTNLSVDTSSTNTTMLTNTDLQSVAMTPAERQALEAEMKAQHHHPLTQRMQQEEEERRFRNEREYRNNSPHYQQRQQLRELQARSRARGSRRDWNRIVQAFESGTAGSAVQSLDDLVVLEAAIMLSSMEPGGSSTTTTRNGAAAAAAAGEGGDGEETEQDFVTRQARAGFPLARARVSAGGAAGGTDSLLSTSRSHRPWMMALVVGRRTIGHGHCRLVGRCAAHYYQSESEYYEYK